MECFDATTGEAGICLKHGERIGDVRDRDVGCNLRQVEFSGGHVLLAAHCAARAARWRNRRTHHKGLAPKREFFRQPFPDARLPAGLLRKGNNEGLDRASASGQLGNGRHVKVAEHGHGDGARDGRGGEHENMGRHGAFTPQRFPLLHPETVLFIDHDQPKVEKLDRVAHQGMGSDHQLRLTRHGGEQRLPALCNRKLPCDERRSQLGRQVGAEGFHQGTQVLGGKHLCRCEKRRLPSAVRDGQHRPKRDDGLP